MHFFVLYKLQVSRRQNVFYASLTDAPNSYKIQKKNENLKKLFKMNLNNQNTKRENSNCKNVKKKLKLKPWLGLKLEFWIKKIWPESIGLGWNWNFETKITPILKQKSAEELPFRFAFLAKKLTPQYFGHKLCERAALAFVKHSCFWKVCTGRCSAECTWIWLKLTRIHA